MDGSTTSLRPANLLTIFQAHFHSRRGNELTFQAGHDLELSGVEWKVLPSGSHTLSSDLLWFTLPDSAESQGHGYDKIGVACFRNRSVTTNDDGNGGIGHVSPPVDEEDVAILDERGARMTAIGIVVASQSSIPSHQLAAAVPHLEPLSMLADTSSLEPRDHSVLKSFLEAHRFNTASSSSCFPSLSTRSPSQLTRWPTSAYDPQLDLPSILNAIGLVLPELLRALLVSGTRLLVFCPQGVETRSAASIAWALAEIVEAAVSLEAAATDCDTPDHNHERYHRIPQVRGIIGLHDISQLQDEEARRRQVATISGVRPTRGWICWTADKLFLDKPDLYDCLLDLTPLIHGIPSRSSGAGRGTTILSAYNASGRGCGYAPVFSRVQRLQMTSPHPPGRHKKHTPSARLQRQTWHTRDFAIYRENEIQAVLYEKKSRRSGRRGSLRTVLSESDDQNQSSSRVRLPTATSSPQKHISDGSRSLATSRKVSTFFAVLVDLVRYYLSTWSILPRPWRIDLDERLRIGGESYGYVPLSIRPDGGVQAGLMLLPDDSDSNEEDEDESNEDEQDSADDTLREGKNSSRRKSNLQSSQGLLHANAAYSTSPAASHRQYTARSSGLDQSDGDEYDDDSGQSAESRPRGSRVRRSSSSAHSCNSGGGDIDPILAACGASPNAPSFGRRASRTSLSGSTASGHSLNRRKSSSSRTSSQRRGNKRKNKAMIDVDTSGDSMKEGATQNHTDANVGTLAPASATPIAEAAPSSKMNERDEGFDPNDLSAVRSGAARQPRDNDSMATTSSRGRTQREQTESNHQLDARETALARALFTAWSEWLQELVDALELFRTSSSASVGETVSPAGSTTQTKVISSRPRSFSQSSLGEDHRPLLQSALGEVVEDGPLQLRSEAVEPQEESHSLHPFSTTPISSYELSSLTRLHPRFTSDRILVKDWTGREIRADSYWPFWKAWT